jgi:hypothetical protein
MRPKYGGRDCELSSTGMAASGASIHADDVTSAVLNEIPAAIAAGGGKTWCSQRPSFVLSDYQRRWPSNGGCTYGDMGHVEVCTPTVLDPFEFARRSLLSVLIAEEARGLAQAAAQENEWYALSTANVDALDPSISFGTHISMTIEQDLWEDFFGRMRRPSRLAMVASGIAAAIPFFGAGYLLPTKDRMIYSLSARAHHINDISTLSTTEAFRRGILNSRREAHGTGFDRLHLIGFDFCLLSGALLFSFLQCLLAAAEESFCRLQLVDPVRALHTWSWGLDLETGKMPETACLVDGRQLTLPQYLRELMETLLQMCENGLIPRAVAPHATELLPKIIELTRAAEQGRVADCARHLTWASKLLCLLNHCQAENQALGDASTRLLDHDYANSNSEQGIIWRLWEQGEVDPLVNMADVKAGWSIPPHDTRDYARGRLIELFADQITDVDWSYVEVRRCHSNWGSRVRIDLPHLDSLNRSQFDALLNASCDLNELIDRLDESRLARTLDLLDDLTPHLALPGNDFTGFGAGIDI